MTPQIDKMALIYYKQRIFRPFPDLSSKPLEIGRNIMRRTHLPMAGLIAILLVVCGCVKPSPAAVEEMTPGPILLTLESTPSMAVVEYAVNADGPWDRWPAEEGPERTP